MAKLGHINIPDTFKTGNTLNQSDKKIQYRGIFTNLLVQRMLLDTITGMRTCSKCQPTELNNMIVDTIGATAARSGHVA